jgi:glycosyltransferase involved in cell wall biosynthesis
MLPKVSCILPCGYGDKYVGVALQSFMDQEYEGDLELVIVDNNDGGSPELEELADSLALFADVVYVRCPRTPVGALRNLGTEHASGDICITWDEDDWSHRNRVAAQVSRLLESQKAVTGWHNILYWDVEAQRGYKYLYEPSERHHPPYAMGTSQCYWKSWWEGHKFVESGPEDIGFSNAALHAKQLDSTDAGQLCVARVHGNNIIPKRQALGQKQFPAVERSQFPQEFFDAIKESE